MSEPDIKTWSSASLIVKLACVDNNLRACAWSLIPANCTRIRFGSSICIFGSDTPRTFTRFSNVWDVAWSAFLSILSPLFKGSTWKRTSKPPCKSRPKLTFLTTFLYVIPIPVNSRAMRSMNAIILLVFFTWTPHYLLMYLEYSMNKLSCKLKWYYVHFNGLTYINILIEIVKLLSENATFL